MKALSVTERRQRERAIQARREQADRVAKVKAAKWQEYRQAIRNAEPNPACRIYFPEVDRPEDIAFNLECRKFEKANG